MSASPVTVQFGQRQGHAAMAAGQFLRVGQGAVGDQQPPHLAFTQVPCSQFDGLAGTDQQHGGIVQPGERVLCRAHGRRGHRHRVGADLGIGPRTLGHREGLLEQAVRALAEQAMVARGRPGVLHLAEDLRFAQHHRVQPGGDPEQVAHSLGIGMLVQIALQVAGPAAQPLVQRLCRLGHGVQFGAVAGGQQHRLGNLRGIAQRTERARQRLTGEGRALAQFHRCGLVIQSEHPQGHCSVACDKLLAIGRHFKAPMPTMPALIRIPSVLLLSLACSRPGGGAGQGPCKGPGH